MESSFPSSGISWAELEADLRNKLELDDPFKFFRYWPVPPDHVRQAGRDATALFFDGFLLGEVISYPSSRELAGELVAMVGDILAMPADGKCTLTTGGTESIFLAVLGAREKARAERPDTNCGQIVLPYSAHPAFDKAAFYLGVEIVRVPIAADYRADIAAMADAITEHTIMIVGSAPQYPHGVVDEIPAVAELGRKYGLWCHVDACIGGFLLPFLKRQGQALPDFDFTVAGVASISADLHKFGYGPTGASTLTVRDAALCSYFTFEFDQWPAGGYGVPTFTGSTSARAFAGAWAVLKTLGDDGFMDIARRIISVGRMMSDGVAAIDGLRLLCPPEAGVVTIGTHGVNCAALGEAMRRSGYRPDVGREPPCLHEFLDPMPDEAVAEYLAGARKCRAGRQKRHD